MAGLGGSPVALAHRGRYPREVDVVGQSAQRGDDAAASPARLELAARADVVLHWPPVRHEDETLLF